MGTAYFQPLSAQQKDPSLMFDQVMFRQIHSNVVSENLNDIMKSKGSGLVVITFHVKETGIVDIAAAGGEAPRFLIDGIIKHMRLVKPTLLPKTTDSSTLYSLPVFFNFSIIPAKTNSEQKDIKQVLDEMEKFRLGKSDTMLFDGSSKSTGKAGIERDKIVGLACVLLPALYFYTPVVD